MLKKGTSVKAEMVLWRKENMIDKSKIYLMYTSVNNTKLIHRWIFNLMFIPGIQKNNLRNSGDKRNLTILFEI